MAWFKVIILGVFGKLIAKLLAPVAVLFVDRNTHPVWGIRDTTDLSYWNCAFRNGAHNMFNRPMPEFLTSGNTPHDWTLEKLEGFQWRKRQSVDGKYVSFRCTWGKPRTRKGKREFYVGWTMNDKPYMRLTFFQLRPF
jgi:hypothetical protein